MPLQLLHRAQFVQFVYIALVPPVNGEHLESPAPGHLVAVLPVRRVEEMQIVSGPQAIFLDGVRLGIVDGHLEIRVVLGDEESPSALCTEILHQNRFRYLPCVSEYAGHGHACRGYPLPLHVPVGLPLENGPVAVCRHLVILESLGSHVLDEGAVGDYDHVPVMKLSHPVLHVVKVLVADYVIRLRKGKGIVILRVVRYRQAESLEPGLPGPVEDLQRRVRTKSRDGDLVLVVAFQNRIDLLLRDHVLYLISSFKGYLLNASAKASVS